MKNIIRRGLCLLLLLAMTATMVACGPKNTNTDADAHTKTNAHTIADVFCQTGSNTNRGYIKQVFYFVERNIFKRALSIKAKNFLSFADRAKRGPSFYKKGGNPCLFLNG